MMSPGPEMADADGMRAISVTTIKKSFHKGYLLSIKTLLILLNMSVFSITPLNLQADAP